MCKPKLHPLRSDREGTALEGAQILYLADKDVKGTTTNMFKEVKEAMLKDLKEGMMIILTK